jgi:carbamoyl-phosphate synthase large subunit
MQAFKAAMSRLPGYKDASVLALDCSEYAPTLSTADRGFIGPRLSDSAYKDYLLNLCIDQSVFAVIPCIDPDIPLLATLRDSFAESGVRVVVSEPEAARICNDKYATYSFFREAGFRVADYSIDLPSLPGDTWPMFIKPRCGSASAHTHRVADRGELEFYWPRVPDPIVQGYVAAPEITIDALLDMAGQPVAAVPRRRLEAIGGESVKGITIGDANLLSWLRRAITVLGNVGARGPVTLQAFLTESEPTISEVNLRFGGGAPLAFAAGADYPEWLLRILDDEVMSDCYGRYEIGTAMTRYYAAEFFQPTQCD